MPFASDAPVAACALLRAQYEALLRSVCAMYAANDVQIERLNAPLNINAQTAAKNLRGAQDMLSNLQKRSSLESGLDPLVAQLFQRQSQPFLAAKPEIQIESAPTAAMISGNGNTLLTPL